MGLFDFLSKKDSTSDQVQNNSRIPDFEDWFKKALSKHLPISPPEAGGNYDKWLSDAYFKLSNPMSSFDWRGADNHNLEYFITPGRVESLYSTILYQLSDAQSKLLNLLEENEELILVTPLLPGYDETDFSLKGLAVITDRRFFLINDSIITQLNYSEIKDIKHMGEIEGYASREGLLGGDGKNGFYVPALVFHTKTLPQMPLEGYEIDEINKNDLKKPAPYLLILFSNSVLRDEFIETLKKVKSDKTKNLPDKILSVSHNDNGVAFFNVGELDKALFEFEKAIQIDPSNVMAYVNRGKVKKEKNELDKALDDYEKAIELDPNFALPYECRGYILTTKGKIDEALIDLTKVIELLPNDAFGYYNRANVWYIAKKDYEKAEADFLKAIELSPADLKYRSAFETFLKNKNTKEDNPDNITENNSVLWKKFQEIESHFGKENDMYDKMSSPQLQNHIIVMADRGVEVFLRQLSEGELSDKDSVHIKNIFQLTTIAGYWLCLAEILANGGNLEKGFRKFTENELANAIDASEADSDKNVVGISPELDKCMIEVLTKQLTRLAAAVPTIEKVSPSTQNLIRNALLFMMLNGYNAGKIEGGYRKV